MNYVSIVFVAATDLITCVKSIIEEHLFKIWGFNSKLNKLLAGSHKEA